VDYVNRPFTNTVFVLTEDCNFRCEYCFIKNNPQRTNWDVCKSLVDYMSRTNKENARPHIQFFGGEPLLEWSFIVDTVNYAKTKPQEFRFGITTNGSLLDEERIMWLKKHQVSILFSVDGPEHVQGIHRKTIDGENTWPLIEDNMRRCVEVGLAPTGRMTYTPQSLPYLAESVEYLLDEIGFRTVAPTPDIDEFMKYSKEDLKEWDRQYEKLYQRFKRKIEAGEWPGLNYETKCFRQFAANRKLPAPGGAGKGMAGVSYDGGLYPCHRFVQWPEWRFGDVWNGVTDPEVRKITATHDVAENNPKCVKCPNLFCGGQCLAANYAVNGSTRAPAKEGCKTSIRQWQFSQRLWNDFSSHPNWKKLFPQWTPGIREANLKGKGAEKVQKKKETQKQAPQTQRQGTGLSQEQRLRRLEHTVQKMSAVVLDLAEGGMNNGQSSCKEQHRRKNPRTYR